MLSHKFIVRETALIIRAEYRIFAPFNILVEYSINGIIRVCTLAYIMKDNSSNDKKLILSTDQFMNYFLDHEYNSFKNAGLITIIF